MDCATASAVGLAMLAVLAGCGGAPLGSDRPPSTDATATPAPLPTDAPAQTRLAPGLTGAGVTEPRTLATAHARLLSNTSYRLVTTRTVRGQDGSLRQCLPLNLSLSADRGYLVHVETEGPLAPVFLGTPPAEATFWSNGSAYLRAYTRGGETTYNEFRPVDGAGSWQYWARTVPFGGPTGTPRNFLGNTFAAVPTRVDGRVEGRAGTNATAYRVAGDRATDSLEGLEDPREVRLLATVTEAGLVRSLRLSYTATVDGETVRVERTLRYGRIGDASAPRPPWADRALGE